MADDTEARANRLGTSILTFGLVGEKPRDGMRGATQARLLTAAGMEAWREGDDEDTAIANACLAVERELRESEWAALELLNTVRVARPESFVAPGTGGASTGPGPRGEPDPPAMVRVPRADVERVAHAVLGWGRPAPALYRSRP
jgi:hypothetical protein